MTNAEALRRRAEAEIRALRATPGAFRQWLELVAAASSTQRLMEHSARTGNRRDWDFIYQHFRETIERADAYAAEVRERFEAELIEGALEAVSRDEE